MKAFWLVVAALATLAAIVGGASAVRAGVERYMLWSGQVLPGMPTFPGTVAGTQAQVAGNMAKSLVVLAAAPLLFWQAQARRRANA